MNKFLRNKAILVDGTYHITQEKHEECLPCEADTSPGVPPAELLAQGSCCMGMASGLNEHSSECPDITAIETPKSLKEKSKVTRRRSGEYKL